MGQLEPAVSVFSSGLGKMATFAWVLIPLALMLSGIVVVLWIKKIRNKKAQWTHKLKIRRVLQDNKLTEPYYINMRRFPDIKRADVFELEKSLLGGYLLPEPAEYSGNNEYSIILRKDNRIFINTGEYYNPDKNSIEVSAKHAEIDVQRSYLKSDFQKINQTSKRIEWSQIAKYALLGIAIIAFMVIGIIAIQKWGEAQQYKAEMAQAQAEAMTQLSDAMKVVESTVNTQKLEIIPMLERLHETKNIRGILSKKINETS